MKIKPPKNHISGWKSKGFALISTVLIMSLLLVLSFAVMSLSSVTSRESKAISHIEIAKDNARLGLMIAIGQLQEYAGADQRVTALADILHEKYEVDSDKKYLTGLWSTEEWNPLRPDEKKEFLSWIVSARDHPADNASSELKLEFASLPFSNPVTLVGKGSTGSHDETQYVKGDKVPVLDEDGTETGSYAYHVGDNSVKANYAVEAAGKPGTNKKKLWQEGARLGSAYHTGLDALGYSPSESGTSGSFNPLKPHTGLDLKDGEGNPITPKNYLEIAENAPLRGVPSYLTLDLYLDGTEDEEGGTTKFSQSHYHSLTGNSSSLLTNTRLGGWKQDLSTAFELSLEDFNNIKQFHASAERNSENGYAMMDEKLGGNYLSHPEKERFYPEDHPLGYLFEIPTPVYRRDQLNQAGVIRGPTWDLLYNYYRTYKKEWDSFDWARESLEQPDAIAARGYLPLSYHGLMNSGNNANEPQKPYQLHPNISTLGTTGFRIYPEWRYDRPYSWRATAQNPPYTFRFDPYIEKNGIVRATAMRIAPTVIRHTRVFGLAKVVLETPVDDRANNYKKQKLPRIVVTDDYFVTIHNPYNRPIEFDSFGFYRSVSSGSINIKYTPADDTDTTEDESAEERAVRYVLGQQSEHVPTLFRLAYQGGNKMYRLEPGEIKVLSSKKLAQPKRITGVNLANGHLQKAKLDYPAGGTSGEHWTNTSGAFWQRLVTSDKKINGRKWKMEMVAKPGTNLEIFLTGGQGKTGVRKSLYSSNGFQYYIFHRNKHDPAKVALDSTFIPPIKASGFKADRMDHPFISKFTFPSYSYGTMPTPTTPEWEMWKNDWSSHPLYSGREIPGIQDPGNREINENEIKLIDDGSGNYKTVYVAAQDFRIRNPLENKAAIHQFSPRAQAHDSRSYNGRDRISPLWSVQYYTLQRISDLQLIKGSTRVGSWVGSDGLKDNDNAIDRLVLYDIPRSPLTSLGSFTHAEIGLLGVEGTYRTANSFLPPTILDPTKIYKKRGAYPLPPASQTYLVRKNDTWNPSGGDFLAHGDLSWAANEALFDQYFFSGANWGNTSLAYANNVPQPAIDQEAFVTSLMEDEDSPLMNSRIHYLASAPDTGASLRDELKDFSKIAKHLVIHGGFNVNSTSVDAWRVVLSAFRSVSIKHIEANSTGTISELHPLTPPITATTVLSRFQTPVGEGTNGKEIDEMWTGFRKLTDKEIFDLATEIVNQVKVRGPFMGMSDFVNRRLVATDSNANVDVGKLGALQAAIEATEINDIGRDYEVDTISYLEPDNATIKVSKDKTITVNSLMGVAGYLMQSDILTSVGSIMRTRSDTFTVRAYGESKNAKGDVVAQAWCEAVVQRTPEWVESSSEPFKVPDIEEITTEAEVADLNKKLEVYTDLSPENQEKSALVPRWKANESFTNEANKKFGRKMQMTSFRWLTKNEI